MTINPALRPLNEITYLSQTKRLFESGELKYYNITERGPEQKGFLGKVWAWILDVFHLRTNLSTYIHAVSKYCQTMPENIASLASRLVVTGLPIRSSTNNEFMAQVNQIAQSIINDGFGDVPSLRTLESTTNPETLRAILEEIHAEVEIPQAIKSLESPIEKYLNFIHENKRSEEFLTQAFELDCNRMNIFVFDKQIGEKKDISISSQSFNQYLLENGLEKNPINHKHFVENELKQAFASDSLELGSQELAIKLRHIKMFANQTVGNDLFVLNPLYSDAINKKMPIGMLADEEIVDLITAEEQRKYMPINAGFNNPTFQANATTQSIQYKGSWNIYEGADQQNSIAEVKCVAGINFAARSLTIIPLKKFSVSQGASIIQMQRLAARFLRQ
jgi:hypothetical protein